MYSFTAAIANELLAQGRADDVLCMIDPLLNAANGDTLSDGDLRKTLPLRCIRARIAVLTEDRPEYAAQLLQPCATFPIVETATARDASAAMWLGWALARSETGDRLRSIYLLNKAAAYFERAHRANERFWAYLGLAVAYVRIGQWLPAETAIRTASVCLRYAQDGCGRQEYETLMADGAVRDLISGCRISMDIRAGVEPIFSAGTEETAFHAAKSRAPLLIAGERGTGKSTLAKHIFALRGLDETKWQDLDCSDTEARYLLADATRFEKLVSETNASTLFLRHIDALPIASQRVLANLLTIDSRGAPRLMASTSSTLETNVRSGSFDTRLFYLLGANEISLPALRDSPERIEPLVRLFKREFSPAGAPLVAITDAALDRLGAYRWPGNIRQLRNEIERILALVALEPIPVIHTQTLDLPIANDRRKSEVEPDLSVEEIPLEDILADTERRVIEKVLLDHEGQITASADSLGLTRQGLYKKIKRLGIVVNRLTKNGSDVPRN